MTDLAARIEVLERRLAGLERFIVCFSGGVDSSYVLRVAKDVAGAGLIALTTVSPTNPDEDTEDAVALADALRIEHVVIHSNELEIPNYRENPINRCYFCKSNLYALAAEEAARRDIRWIVDGVNADDLGDYRPGLQAADERRILHPLAEAGFAKADVRTASRALGLKTWDRPASPCLSSRFPYGTAITTDGLERVGRGEKLLRALGFRECRVRFYGDTARIEVRQTDLAKLQALELREAVESGLREIGFRKVEIDPRGFRSGSLNEALSVR